MKKKHYLAYCIADFMAAVVFLLLAIIDRTEFKPFLIFFSAYYAFILIRDIGRYRAADH